MQDRSGVVEPETTAHADLATDEAAASAQDSPKTPASSARLLSRNWWRGSLETWLLVAVVFLVLVISVTLTYQVKGWEFVDLQVYRNGARAWLDGSELYGPMPKVSGVGLPFTYPPLAALFFAPLALMSLSLAKAVVLATSVLSLGGTLWLVLARLRPRMDRMTLLFVVVGAVLILLLSEPVRQTIGYGQINLVLMAAVALDCLVRKPFWPRGMLIGIAVSVKLIPAGFLLYFLLRKDWKTAGTLVVSAVCAVGLGFVLFPSDSVEYWFHTLSDTGRIGAPQYAGNQSLKGFAFRLGVSDGLATAIWLLLAVVVVGLAAVWMRRLLAEGANVAALLVNAAAVLLVSPVSWSHHWVWLAPALVVVADAIARGRRHPLFLAAVAGFVVMFAIGPQWLLPNEEDRELAWSWWEQIVGSSYVLATFVVLAVAALTYRPAVAGVRKDAKAAA